MPVWTLDPKQGGLGVAHRLERERVPARTLSLEGEWIVRSNVCLR